MPRLTSVPNSPISVDENPIICFPAEESTDFKQDKIRDSMENASGFPKN